MVITTRIVSPKPQMSIPQPLRLFASVSRLHIVAIATLGCFTFGWLFTERYLFGVALITASDWFIVNLLNRVVDLREDRANAIVGTGFVDRNKKPLTIAGFALLFASLGAGHFFWPALLPFRICYHALGLAYNWPILPGPSGRRRIKQLYFFKNTASAVGFMLTVFAYPLAVAPLRVSTATVVMTGVFFFLFELSYEVLYDLRDMEGDRLASAMTYPVVHGERGAIFIIDGLIATATAALLGGYLFGVLPWRIFVMIGGPVLQVIVYKRALKRGICASDCIRLTWYGTGLLLAYHLWVVLGLPGVGI